MANGISRVTDKPELEPGENVDHFVCIKDGKVVLVSGENIVLPAGGAGGQPAPIYRASQMTDTDAIYLYLGDEEGYDYGYLYAYLNDAWTKTALYGKGEDGANGKDGDDGTTYLPSVDEHGILSWTNDGGKENPADANLVQAVINALPWYYGDVI